MCHTTKISGWIVFKDSKKGIRIKYLRLNPDFKACFKRFSLDGFGSLQHFLQWVQKKYEIIFVNWDKVPKNSHLYDYINMNENQFFFQEQLSRSYLGQFSKVQPVQARYLVGCVLPTKILPICPTELNPWKDSLWDYIKKFSTRSST